jgi:hypothetical protein
MILLFGAILIMSFCIFTFVQPNEQYRTYYFPIIVGGGTILIIINEYAEQRKLAREKKCHNCKRQDRVLHRVNSITRYWMCNECPKKSHLILRRGGTIIVILSVMVFIVEPMAAHVVFGLGLTLFFTVRNGHAQKQHFKEGRCYRCKKQNDTVRLVQTRHIPKYLVCYECPLQNDVQSSEA